MFRMAEVGAIIGHRVARKSPAVDISIARVIWRRRPERQKPQQMHREGANFAGWFTSTGIDAKGAVFVLSFARLRS